MQDPEVGNIIENILSIETEVVLVLGLILQSGTASAIIVVITTEADRALIPELGLLLEIDFCIR